MEGNGKPSGAPEGGGGSNARAIVVAGLATAYAAVIAGTGGVVQLIGIVALVLVTAAAVWLFAPGRGD